MQPIFFGQLERVRDLASEEKTGKTAQRPKNILNVTLAHVNSAQAAMKIIAF